MDDVKGLIERLRLMGDRTKRHDYATGDYWNIVDEAADALEAMETQLHNQRQEKNQIIGNLKAELARVQESYRLCETERNAFMTTAHDLSDELAAAKKASAWPNCICFNVNHAECPSPRHKKGQ